MDRLGYDPGVFINGQAPAIDATLMNALKNALNTSAFNADQLASTSPGAYGLTYLSKANQSAMASRVGSVNGS